MILAQKLEDRAVAGKEGAVAVVQASDGKGLKMIAGKQLLDVLDLQGQLHVNSGLIKFGIEDFQGRLLIDDRGSNDDAPIRLVLSDDARKPIVSTETEEMDGFVYLAAVTEEGKPFVYSALFKRQPAHRSAAWWGCTQELLYYLDLQRALFLGENGDEDGQVV